MMDWAKPTSSRTPSFLPHLAYDAMSWSTGTVRFGLRLRVAHHACSSAWLRTGAPRMVGEVGGAPLMVVGPAGVCTAACSASGRVVVVVVLVEVVVGMDDTVPLVAAVSRSGMEVAAAAPGVMAAVVTSLRVSWVCSRRASAAPTAASCLWY